MPQVHAFRRLTIAALTLVLALIGSTAFAQTDVTTSRISGVVTDSSNAPLPGVTVEAKNTETGFAATHVTDTDGAYRLVNLPTGKYTVTASLEGFNKVARSVDLKLGSAPTINFSLGLSAVSETITVTSAAPLVEVTNTAASTTITTEEIKDLPLNGRNFVDLVYLTPETRRERERGNIAISGQRGINTNVTVDGVDYNNSFFGGTAGTAEGRAPLSISQESVKEFTVITNGASVEFGRSAGGFVNVITKSGTNAMHGSAFYYSQPQSLISDFADGRKPADQKKDQYGGSFGGRIIPDRLFYFASYDQQKQNQTVPISAVIVDAEIFAKYPSIKSDSDYGQTTDGRVIFGRLDFQATPAHRFMARGNYTTYNGDHGTSAATNRSSLTNGVEGLDSRTYVGSWSGTFGNSLLNDFNTTYSDEFTPREPAPGSENLPEIIMGTTTTYGGVSFLPITSTVQRTAFADTISYLWKSHVFKAGFDYNDTSVEQIFKGNWRGVFQFTGTFAQAKAKLLAGKWDQYRQFGGLGGLTSDQAGGVSFGQKETALFVQDQWYLRPNLTISAGVRWEKLDNPDQPVLNPNDKNANGSFKLNGKIPDVDNQYSPRLGVTWSPWTHSVIRGTVGRYWSRTPALLWAQLFSSNGVRGTQYIINAATGGTCPTDPLSPGWGSASDNCRGAWTPDGVERIDFTKVTNIATPGVFSVDPNFTNPQTDRFTLGWEQELAQETALGLDYTWAESKNLERLTDINLQYQRDAAGNVVLGTNGLPRYSSTRPNTAYGRITTYISDARSEYWALTATARKRWGANFRTFANLTYSEDKDNDSNERNFSGIQAEDVNNLDGTMFSYSERDQRWRANTTFAWDVKWGIGLSGSFSYASGQAYSARLGTDANNDGNNVERPTVGGKHFDRNSFRQPAFSSVSLRVAKAFNFGPGALTVFGECFNCANAANRTVSTTNQTWGAGQTPVATFGVRDQVTQTPRTIQLAVRYDF
ncbi:MAG TPA: TonB-dependent receptor [Thermoanaerobaculia bacterium]|nr:TonB-dependent receptor [Thermoanaerobaculia bacterium]